ncbi:MAG: alpha/beta hydrolase [Phycisphaerae bacterium]
MSAAVTMHRLYRFVFAALLLALCGRAIAAEPRIEPLWPDGAPLARADADADKPTLTIYLPPKDKATGAAVVICPGGGYGNLAMDHEGHQVARWLNSFGVAGLILTYRHHGTGYAHPAPLLDAQRAIRTVRARAKEWGIKPDRIGILGFSAGGHLASTAGTHFDKGDPGAKDPIDRVSCRTDFMVLVYPVISFTEWYAHKGSRKNLLGEDPDPRLVESLSNEKQVTPDTPPTFLVHTSGDTGVPAENSVAFYLALRKAGVPAEMHIFARGEHGFGLGKKGDAVAVWPSLCVEWMRGLGVLNRQ